MKQNFIVLHKVSPKPIAGKSPGKKATSLKNLASKKKATMKMDIEAMDPSQARKMNEKEDVIAVAPAIPIKLIKPFKVARARAATIAWGISAVRADQSPYTGKGIKIAVLDTGIDKNHPAFTGVKIIEKDFTGEGNGDQNGHGTHCAGTIFGRAVNNNRIGVAPGVKNAIIGKVLGESGGSSDKIVEAMQWAIQKGANILSMSLGIDFPGYVEYLIKEVGLPADLATSKALQDYRANTLLFDTYSNFVNTAASQGFSQPVIIIAAAGNESKLDVSADYEIGVSPPAIAEGIYSVAALDQNDENYTIAPFSNSGAMLSAPGVNILSAKAGGGLVAYSGTSMATPHVAGVAALWMEKLIKENKNVYQKIGVQLQANCDTSGLMGQLEHLYGWGLVQAPLR
ncbi:MAG: S8 family peptidase [Flavitalea sp.]